MGDIGRLIVSVLTLGGSLGVFLYGMKILSEGLQKVAGDRMRVMLAAMTSSPLKRIMTGLVVTAVIQSSSATTVMVVSFVNAGLLSLIQAAGVIMGANVGTTVTAWIISLLGFKFDISALSLPLIGVAVPFLFSKKQMRRSLGELILGFSLIFLGLMYLKASVPDLQQYPAVLEWLGQFTRQGVWSVLLFVLIGAGLTVIVQSSSATVALTLIMCSNGWIDFPTAAAMVLGENIGTTVTANIAAAVGNVLAKRAALFHLIFNLFGVFWVLLIFTPFLSVIDLLTVRGGMDSPLINVKSIPFALSLFHTAFNVTNTLVLVWFTPQLVRLVTRLRTAKEREEEEFRLRHIRIGMVSTGELALQQAKSETEVYARRTYRMFGFVRSMLDAPNDRELRKIYDRVVKYEQISDRMEVEIAKYLSQVKGSELSYEGGQMLQAILKIISDIENVADYCNNMADIIMRRHEDHVVLNEHIMGHINHMLELVDRAFGVMESNLAGSYSMVNLDRAYECEDRINQYRNRLKSEHVGNVESGVYSYQAGTLFSDFIAQCERVGDSIINISEDIAEIDRQIKGLEEGEMESKMA